jgi:hypothetical protein
MRNNLDAAVVLYNWITNFNSIHMGIDERISIVLLSPLLYYNCGTATQSWRVTQSCCSSVLVISKFQHLLYSDLLNAFIKHIAVKSRLILLNHFRIVCKEKNLFVILWEFCCNSKIYTKIIRVQVKHY